MTAASSPLSVVFAGTPEFSATVLESLCKKSDHKLLAVYTQPDRRAGRGRTLRPSAVKVAAQTLDIPVYQPATLSDVQTQEQLAGLGADIMVVVAYGLILPQVVLDMFPHGCVNVHASLLPRWRGAAPIQRAILAGDEETGVTIMQMDAGLDTGDMLAKAAVPIGAQDTAEDVHDRLALAGSELLLHCLDDIADGLSVGQVQDPDLACYAEKLKKQEGLLQWQQAAPVLHRLVRAFTPWPGAFTVFEGANLKVLQVELLAEQTDAEPGLILRASAEGIDVACGQGVLRLLKIQLPGGKPLAAKDFLNARQQVRAGYQLGSG